MSSFENVRESQKGFTDEQLEAEKSRLLNEIGMLGVKMDEAGVESKKYDKALEDKKNELASLDAQIEGYAPSIAKHEDELARLKQQIEDAVGTVAQNGDLDLLNEKKKQELERNENAVRQAQAQAAVLQSTIDKLANEEDDLTIKRNALKNECDAIIETRTRSVGELELRVSQLNASVKDLESQVSQLAAQANLHTENANSQKAMVDAALLELADARKKLEETNAEIEKAKIDAEAAAKRKGADLDAREKAIEAREGDASLKESWLKEKAKSLNAIKIEMELYLGRKLPVNIPQEDVI